MKIASLFSVCAILLVGTSFLQAEAKWTEDYSQALKEAKATHKKVLLDFTGSDWCSWCVKLDKDVYSKPEFAAYAEKNLVLVKIDFPQEKAQSEKIKTQNAKLQEQFKVEGFPTTIVLDSDGKKLGQMVGYVRGGPAGFQKAVEAAAQGKSSDQ